MLVIVFAEGSTEEQFIKRVVAPSLRAAQIFIKPQLLKTSKDANGWKNYALYPFFNV
ncbi:MAG: hypothetical protein R8K48_03010 [Gallionella sp.]